MCEFSGLRGAAEECPRRRVRGTACVAPETSPAAGPRTQTFSVIPLRPAEQLRGTEGENTRGERKGKVCSKSKLWAPEEPGARPLPPRTRPRAPRPPGFWAGTPTPDTESCARRPGILDSSTRCNRGERRATREGAEVKERSPPRRCSRRSPPPPSI